MADNIEPTTHLEKVIAGQESPITHLEKVIALYGGSGGSGVGSEALEELDNKIEALKSTQSLEYEGKNITCENTLASRTSDMLIKGQTYQNLFRRIDSQTTQEQDDNYVLTGVANKYSMLSIYPSYNLQKNNKYTVIIDVKNINTTDNKPFKFDGFNGNTWVCGTKITTTGLQKIPLQGTQDITEIRLQINNGVDCNITISKNIIILKGDWTKKEVPASITGIESAGEKENKINILSNNNKLVDDIDYKEDKKEILLPIQGGLKSLPNGVYDTIEQKADGIYLVQRVKKETYVNGDENNNNYLTDKVNTYKPLEAPVETKLDIQNLDLEVYKDITYVTTDNAIQPTLDFKVPSNMGGIMQGNSQNINKLYKLINEVVDKTDITTIIGPMSTHNQVPSAKAMYDVLKITLIGSKQLNAYGKEIVKYPLGRWGTMGMGVKNLTDLPSDDVKYVEILGISDSATPWTVGLSTRTYRATTEDGAIFTRSITSGEQGGVIEKDTGWQKVCYTKIPDVPVTKITITDKTNYNNLYSAQLSYCVVSGICYISGGVECLTPPQGNVQIATLPKPSMGYQYFRTICTNTSKTEDIDHVRYMIGLNGEFRLIKGLAGGEYRGTFSYPVDKTWTPS